MSWVELMDSMSDEQGRRLLSYGDERQLDRGAVLLERARPVDAIFIVQSGQFGVHATEHRDEPLAVLGAGEVIGEMSFLDREPASASVVATEPSRVLALPQDRLRSFLAEEPVLAAEFARRLGILQVRRLRSTLRRVERSVDEVASVEAELVQRVRRQLDAFKGLLHAYDRALLARDGEARQELEDTIPTAFARLTSGLQSLVGDGSSLDEQQRIALGHVVQREMMPLLQLTEVARRMYAKPRGYAGDFRTIELIYERKAGGHGALGRLLDACFLAEPAAQAVRNRRGLLAEQIGDELRAAQADSRMARITSLACGPAREVYDVQRGSPLADRLVATLVDMDAKALGFVAKRQLSQRPPGRVRLVKENLIHLAMGRSELDLAPQDLVYSIGLIDYLSDEQVILLLDWVHGLLGPGGRVILGNFHPANPTKALMDHVLEWRLQHRDEADMHRLFEASRFARGCTRVLFEEQGINLFAECTRQG